MRLGIANDLLLAAACDGAGDEACCRASGRVAGGWTPEGQTSVVFKERQQFDPGAVGGSKWCRPACATGC